MTPLRFAWFAGWVFSLLMFVPGVFNIIVGIATLDGSQGGLGSFMATLGLLGGGAMVAWTKDGIPQVNIGLPRHMLKEQREADRNILIEAELERRRIEREARTARLERELRQHEAEMKKHETWMSTHSLEAGPAKDSTRADYDVPIEGQVTHRRPRVDPSRPSYRA